MVPFTLVMPFTNAGKEWTTHEGKVLHRRHQWVKVLSSNGRIRNVNWTPVYNALRMVLVFEPWILPC
jgi:hypothetical protein